MNNWLTILAVIVFNSNVFASTVTDTLYINRDSLNQGGYVAHYCTFNRQDIFSPPNAPIELSIGDTLDLTIINNDSLVHSFNVDNILTANNEILPFDTNTFKLTFNQEGSFRYYSEFPYGELLGASGNILVGYESYNHFFWNLFESHDSISNLIATGALSSLPPDYQPQIFTINNYIYPETLNDTLGKVVGNVSDTLIISIVNSGSIIHSFHFHGYHIEILTAHKSTNMLGWVKDTFPVYPGDAMTVQLVPDKPGLFPVHDHNLISVSTGSYPGGMITTLHIQP